MKTMDKIKTLRIKKGYSQEELGKIIGVQKAAINKYETGIVTNIPSDKIKLLANVFNVSPVYLMAWEIVPEKADIQLDNV